MGLLDSLLGNPQQQQEYQNYVSRYQQGVPHEGYSDQEVLQRYQQVAPQLPPEDYQRAAEQAFSRMSPAQRMQFGQYVQQQAQAQNTPAPGFGQGVGPEVYEDPRYLAQQTTQIHQQQPGALTQLLGGGGPSGMLGSPVAKAALAGIAAMAISNVMGGGGGSPLGGVLGSVLGGQNQGNLI
jgi:hypothetical protein